MYEGDEPVRERTMVTDPVKGMIFSYLASRQGQETIRTYLTSPEGQKTICDFLATPQGKETLAKVLPSLLSCVPLTPETRANVIKETLGE